MYNMEQSQVEALKEKLKEYKKQLQKEIELHRYIAGKFKQEGNREHILHSTIEGKMVTIITYFDELFKEYLEEPETAQDGA